MNLVTSASSISGLSSVDSGNRVSNNLAILIKNETGKGFLKAFDIVVCIVENKSNIIIIH